MSNFKQTFVHWVSNFYSEKVTTAHSKMLKHLEKLYMCQIDCEISNFIQNISEERKSESFINW